MKIVVPSDLDSWRNRTKPDLSSEDRVRIGSQLVYNVTSRSLSHHRRLRIVNLTVGPLDENGNAAGCRWPNLCRQCLPVRGLPAAVASESTACCRPATSAASTACFSHVKSATTICFPRSRGSRDRHWWASDKGVRAGCAFEVVRSRELTSTPSSSTCRHLARYKVPRNSRRVPQPHRQVLKHELRKLPRWVLAD